MSIERIDRADDPRVAAYHGVRDGELLRFARAVCRRRAPHIPDASSKIGRYRVQSVLVNEAHSAISTRRSPGSTRRCRYSCAAETSWQPSPATTCIADAWRSCTGRLRTSVDVLLAPAGVLVVLEGVTNADNVGGVFRNAAAFRAGGVLLSPTCCDPLYRKAIRTSMGATLRVPFARASCGRMARRF
jgi:hypothetical protein